jgi:proline iminopeptidase
VRELYPAGEPFAEEMLGVGDGHTLYLAQYGNPEGVPAVFLHGGPGGGTEPKQARFFDPEFYRVILFDQRQCGRSAPHASLPGADLSANTTWHLADDVEAIRDHLGIERWLVFGGSWGSALALAYAERHPGRVTGLVLRGIFTLRRFELDWFYNGPAGLLQPAAWEGFTAPLRQAGFTPADGLGHVVPGDPRHDNIAAYHALLFGPDHLAAQAAGEAWTRYEAELSYLEPGPGQPADPAYALAFARIENHYFVNAGFFAEGQLIRDAPALQDIPTTIVQGRYDLCCPARTAADLAGQLPQADLRLVLAGHSAFEPAIASELVAATDRHKRNTLATSRA